MNHLCLYAMFCAWVLCSCATTPDRAWHATRSARFATWGISGAVAGSLGRASPAERLEVGGEAWSIFTLFAYAGAGPYIRVRPLPGSHGRKFFLHTAAYGGYQMGPGKDDSRWRVLPNAFIGYEPKPKQGRPHQHFYGVGSEGIFVIGWKF